MTGGGLDPKSGSLPPLPAQGQLGAPVPAAVGAQTPVTLLGSLVPGSLVPVLGPQCVLLPDPLLEFFHDVERDGEVSQTQSATLSPGAEDQERVLVFGLGPENYGLGIMGVREILKPGLLTEVPRAPPEVLGVFSLRGQVVPVLALQSILGVAAEPRGGGAEARILVLGRGEDSVGFWVHRVANVVKMDLANLEPPPAGLAPSRRTLILGLGRAPEGLIILLKLEHLFLHLGLKPEAARPEPS